MHKLVILIEALDDWQALEDAWPEYLHQVEEMPGLRREAISRVDDFLYGTVQYARMHELFFDSLEAARLAMVSPAGQAAGRLLQRITAGNMVLFFAEHKEDVLDNIQKYKKPPTSNAAAPDV